MGSFTQLTYHVVFATKYRRPTIALPKAGARHHIGTVVQSGENRQPTPIPTADVITDMGDTSWSGFSRQKSVETGHPVRLRGRNGETLTDVIERALADPSDRPLHCLQRWEKEVSVGDRLMKTTVGNVTIDRPAYRTTIPRRGR